MSLNLFAQRGEFMHMKMNRMKSNESDKKRNIEQNDAHSQTQKKNVKFK